MIKATRQQRTALYRLFDAESCLLYVGISGYPTLRFQQHAADKPWWPDVASHTIEWLDDRPTAEKAEIRAVLAEKPRHNSEPAIKPAPKSPRLSAYGNQLGRRRFVPTLEEEEKLGRLTAAAEYRDEVLAELWVVVNRALSRGIPPAVVAQQVGLSRSTMYRKLREHGHDPTT